MPVRLRVRQAGFVLSRGRPSGSDPQAPSARTDAARVESEELDPIAELGRGLRTEQTRKPPNLLADGMALTGTDDDSSRLHRRTGAADRSRLVCLLATQLLEFRLFRCQLGFDLVTVSVVMGQGSVDLGKVQLGEMCRDLLWRLSPIVQRCNLVDRHASARDSHSPAANVSRAD